MTTLLASLIGFFSSIIPEIIKIFKDNQDKKHELNIFDKQLNFAKANKNLNLHGNMEENITSRLSELSILHQNYKVNIKWVDALNASVRPMLAYSFFLLYAFIKFTQYNVIYKDPYFMNHLSILWTLEDQAIFASIISFYFGQRTFKKLLK